MHAQPVSLVITGTVEDRHNANVAIRTYMARGFRELGDHVEVREMPYEAVVKATSIGSADILVAVGGLALDTTNLAALRRAADGSGAALAFWLHDDPYEFDYSFRLRGLADMVFTSDSWAAWHYGEIAARHMPLAACASAHHRPIERERQRDLSFFFCGYAYANRVSFFREAARLLRRHATHLCGAEWPADIPFARNERLSPQMFALTAARSLFTFNIGRDLSIANARFNLAPSTPGPRTFEVAMMGSAQLYLAESLEICDYFEPGTEIILIDSIADVERWIEISADDPARIVEIAAAAQARALRSHRYVHRAGAVLDALAARGLIGTRPLPAHMTGPGAAPRREALPS